MNVRVDLEVKVRYDTCDKHIVMDVFSNGSSVPMVTVNIEKAIKESVQDIQKQRRRVHHIEHENLVKISEHLDKLAVAYKKIVESLWIRYYF